MVICNFTGQENTECTAFQLLGTKKNLKSTKKPAGLLLQGFLSYKGQNKLEQTKYYLTFYGLIVEVIKLFGHQQVLPGTEIK